MDNATEPLAAGVWRIEVGTFTNAYLVARDGAGDGAGLVLVDAGSHRKGPRLVRSIRLLGFDPLAIDTLLLTHWHADHAGSAARFAASSASPSIRVRPPDDAVVAGREAPRITHRGRLRRLLHLGLPRPTSVTTIPLVDGEAHPGGLEVVAAPGHTRGHTAFWLPHRGVLLAGDALFGVLRASPGPRLLAADPDAVATTLRRLADLDPAVVAVGHGPPLRRFPARRLAALADRAAPSGRR